MAATINMTIIAQVRELGEDIDIRERFDTTTTPTTVTHVKRTLATADTPEMLDLGGVAVSLCEALWFKASGGNFWLDTTVSTAGAASDFQKEVYVPSGKSVFITPTGTTASIGVLGSTAATFEYLAGGTV